MNTDFIIPGKAEELAAQFEDQAQEMLISYAMLSDEAKSHYVITVADLPMSITGNKPTWVPLRNATTFVSSDNAYAIARQLRNGNGDRGRVLLLAHAYIEAIRHLQDMAKELRASAELRA